MPGKPAETAPQPRISGPETVDRPAALARRIRGALEGYLDGRRLVRVQIRQVEGNRIEGFLKIDAGQSERLLVDFRAASTPQGGLSSLEVGGRKIVLASSAPAE